MIGNLTGKAVKILGGVVITAMITTFCWTLIAGAVLQSTTTETRELSRPGDMAWLNSFRYVELLGNPGQDVYKVAIATQKGNALSYFLREGDKIKKEYDDSIPGKISIFVRGKKVYVTFYKKVADKKIREVEIDSLPRGIKEISNLPNGGFEISWEGTKGAGGVNAPNGLDPEEISKLRRWVSEDGIKNAIFNIREGKLVISKMAG